MHENPTLTNLDDRVALAARLLENGKLDAAVTVLDDLVDTHGTAATHRAAERIRRKLEDGRMADAEGVEALRTIVVDVIRPDIENPPEPQYIVGAFDDWD